MQHPLEVRLNQDIINMSLSENNVDFPPHFLPEGSQLVTAFDSHGRESDMAWACIRT